MKKVVIVGGGHAGIEAALAVARAGLSATLVTLDINHIGSMPCNPSIGGPAKGVIVREIDALGGEMAHAADATYFQMKKLNTSKGPGVQCLRAQSDKLEYVSYMIKKVKSTENLLLIESMATELIVENGICKGVILEDGKRLDADAVILTTGTYLHGKTLIGHTFKFEGPDHQRAAVGLSESLRANGFDIQRLKTGTPPRVLADSVDYSCMEIQPGTQGDLAFSYDTTKFIPLDQQKVCYLIHTTLETKKIILEHLKDSAMYGGMVEGIGPRYCPSIEDKIVKFADKDRHQLFIEPESVHLDTIYVQGFSTSMPEVVQEQMIRTLPGFKNCVVKKYAYAIEYDAIDPLQLKPSLETMPVENLFCAGQINGTSGYEEAAGQGLIAGINATLKLKGKKPLILRRDEAYIGVMIDDLVTKGTKEPYRMLTSRAEYRLLLRHDNADLRLREYGYRVGLVNDTQYQAFLTKKAEIEELEELLKETKFKVDSPLSALLVTKGDSPLETTTSGYNLLKRPSLSIADLTQYLTKKYSAAVLEEVEINIKYEGYIKKQQKTAETQKKLEEQLIPNDIDYNKIENIALEARQKLSKIRPISIGQASRISGVNPSDIGILLLHIKAKER
ncbi:MAG: tRNA uridine-5-carboxymethylaminomethyl(34) synthesis enzyme MnmG [Bacilli bacterium]|nr:tRNA uridine-5-carboxymethylaminomethyl(34) synthesis enzyme MnmG [Bacilli bacterium]